MKPRKSVSIYVLLVGVMGLLIVGGIFSFQLIDEATKNQLPTKQRDLIKQLEGKIETKVIENITKRKVFSKDDLIYLPPSIITTVATPESTDSSAKSLTETTTE